MPRTAGTTDMNTDTVDIDVSPSPQPRSVSRTLFGAFVEDINFGVDGGLNANLVSNHSFEGIYVDRGVADDGSLVITPAGRKVNPLLNWTVTGGRAVSSEDRPAAGGERFARITPDGLAQLTNNGYPGTSPAIPLRRGVALHFAALIRTDEFEGSVEVSIHSANGERLGSGSLKLEESGWHTVRAELIPGETALGFLQIEIEGMGDIDLDEMFLTAKDHWGAGEPRWSQGVLRRDLVEALRDLNPTFVRFPGGCLVEGCGGDTHFKWKNSIGPLIERRPEMNLWGQMRSAGDYTQSMQVGFYEYFLLCEDLGAEPMPIVWAGLSCQYRTDESVAVDSAEFEELLRDAIDLIDWATGDPTTNRWAALRAAAGHPEPFSLNFLGIGNENFGQDYLDRFDMIRSALERRRPGLTFVIASGANPDGPEFDQAWNHARPHAELVVDEHFYKSPQWFLDSVDRYDSYPRGGARVFMGEYAAHEPALLIDANTAQKGPAAPGTSPTQIQTNPDPANTWKSAVAEAAFLTGVERNSDAVAMTCYAPLFNLVGSSQWLHNLINFNPLIVAPTPNYYVQQLFGTRLGTKIAEVSGDLADGLYVSASYDDLETHTKIVNASAHERRVRLRIAGTTTGMAEIVTLTGDPDHRNTIGSDTTTPNETVIPKNDVVATRSGLVTMTVPPWSVVSVSTGRE